MVASAAQTAPTLWGPTSINHSAAFNPQAEREPCLRALIEAHANLEATEKDGSTALMIAARDAHQRSKGPSTPVWGAPWTAPGGSCP